MADWLWLSATKDSQPATQHFPCWILGQAGELRVLANPLPYGGVGVEGSED